MAFTRATLRTLAKESGVDLPKELEDAIITEHITARNAHAEAQVKAELEKQPKPEAVKVKDSEEYKALKKSFDDYKSDVEGKQAKEAKEKAARAYYESKGITGKNLDIAMRGSRAEIDGIELDGEKIKDNSALDALVKGDFSGLVGKVETKGADPATPPANGGGKQITKKDIMAIKDYDERVAAIEANPQLFGYK